jgi:hypothetical protein
VLAVAYNFNTLITLDNWKTAMLDMARSKHLNMKERASQHPVYTTIMYVETW